MFQTYFEVFYSLLVGHTFRTLKIHHLFTVGLKIELLFCIRATKVKFFTPWYLTFSETMTSSYSNVTVWVYVVYKGWKYNGYHRHGAQQIACNICYQGYHALACYWTVVVETQFTTYVIGNKIKPMIVAMVTLDITLQSTVCSVSVDKIISYHDNIPRWWCTWDVVTGDVVATLTVAVVTKVAWGWNPGSRCWSSRQRSSYLKMYQNRTPPGHRLLWSSPCFHGKLVP